MTAASRVLVAASSAASVLMIAAPAGAATVATSPCVRTAPGVSVQQPISGSGFVPGSQVTLKAAPAGSTSPLTLTSVTADAAGNFVTAASPPSFNPFSRKLQTFNLGAFDPAGALLAATKFEKVEVGYTTNPSSGSPTRSALHTVRGFPAGRNIYLHFRFQGQTKRNVKVGRAAAPCGVASKRMALLPTRSRPGRWTVYVDQKSTYSKNTSPQLKGSFTIRRTFG